ncbi:class I SAM-dependent methyltransferase [uncultured Deinococcus sp.]|uniref:class I SAM-dependent methyltransferase n=2 Tax=uncultured Deinococcus sp. TaxID=158789 RepID=UPI002586A414|nr:class I SAM-dependent methyltransferase [uncultured Deinococcus sp.]
MRPERHPKDSLNHSHAAPALSRAQLSNLAPLTARGYMLWRAQSLTLLSGQPFGLERERALFLGQCRPQAGERWLDAGTSAGFYAGVLAARGCAVLAADLSPAMLREGQRRETSPLIDWALLNLESSGLPDASFDGVTVGATLNETNDPARFLGELARVLRPGGQLWLMYVARTGGPGQTALSTLGGLNFFDPAWTGLQLPQLRRRMAFRSGNVQFEHFLKEAGPDTDL